MNTLIITLALAFGISFPAEFSHTFQPDGVQTEQNDPDPPDPNIVITDMLEG